MKNNSEIIIYCDGACSGNPGPGGWGSIVIHQGNVVELGGGNASTTNNRMEMTAVLSALNYCISGSKSQSETQIQIFTDSVYVIRGITQWIFGWKKRGWKTAENEDVSNRDIWVELDEAVKKAKSILNADIKWHFIKGHSGVPGNERCDEIAVAFSKNQYINLFSGYAPQYIFDVGVLPEPRPLPEIKKDGGASVDKPVWYLSLVNGIFSKHQTWKECEAVVKGRPAKFKKVSSIEEETEVKKSWGLN